MMFRMVQRSVLSLVALCSLRTNAFTGLPARIHFSVDANPSCFTKHTNPTKACSSQLSMVSMEKLGFGKLSIDKATIDKFATGSPFDGVVSAGSNILTPVFKRPVLATLDFSSIMLFASIGKASHSAGGSLDLMSIAVTALPFLLSWFAISPLTGCYDAESTLLSKNDSSPRRFLSVLGTTCKGWSLAIPMGCLLRGVIKGYVPPTPFIVVTLISTAILLGGSRVLFSIVDSNIQELKEYKKW